MLIIVRDIFAELDGQMLRQYWRTLRTKAGLVLRCVQDQLQAVSTAGPLSLLLLTVTSIGKERGMMEHAVTSRVYLKRPSKHGATEYSPMLGPFRYSLQTGFNN